MDDYILWYILTGVPDRAVHVVGEGPGTAGEIGARIERERRKHGLTQKELADLTGVNRQYVSELETGKATKHLDRLVAVLDVLGMQLQAVPRTATLAVERTAEPPGRRDA